MKINEPNILDEVTKAFERYEQALIANDVAALDELFWDDAKTIRYGVTEILYGYDEIKAFRAGRSPFNLARRLERTQITTFGENFATANTLFRREGGNKIGRQSQTWMRTPAGWRVVSAHVSLMDPPAA
jgi:ketosteroid isomerase-like protein